MKVVPPSLIVASVVFACRAPIAVAVQWSNVGQARSTPGEESADQWELDLDGDPRIHGTGDALGVIPVEAFTNRFALTFVIFMSRHERAGCVHDRVVKAAMGALRAFNNLESFGAHGEPTEWGTCWGSGAFAISAGAIRTLQFVPNLIHLSSNVKRLLYAAVEARARWRPAP